MVIHVLSCDKVRRVTKRSQTWEVLFQFKGEFKWLFPIFYNYSETKWMQHLWHTSQFQRKETLCVCTVIWIGSSYFAPSEFGRSHFSVILTTETKT